MVLDHLADLFDDASIVGAFALMLHMREAVTIGTLTKMDAFIGGVILETPPALLDSGFFVVPSISEGVRSTLGLGLLLLRYLPGDVVDNWWGDVVVGISSP